MWFAFFLVAACPDATIAAQDSYSAWVVHGHGEVRAGDRVVRVIRDDNADCAAIERATLLALRLIAERDGEPARRPLAVAAPLEATTRQRQWGALGVQAEAGIAIGLGPRAQTAIAGALAWRLNSFSLAAGALYAFPAREDVSQGAAELSIILATVGGCYQPAFFHARLRPSACLDAWLGAARGSAWGLTANWTVYQPTAFAVPGVGLSGHALSALDWMVSCHVPIALAQPGFQVLGYGRVLAGAHVGVVVSAGMSLWIL